MPQGCRRSWLKKQTTTSNVSWRLDFFDFPIFSLFSLTSHHFFMLEKLKTHSLWIFNFPSISRILIYISHFHPRPNFSNKAVSTFLRCLQRGILVKISPVKCKVYGSVSRGFSIAHLMALKLFVLYSIVDTSNQTQVSSEDDDFPYYISATRSVCW